MKGALCYDPARMIWQLDRFADNPAALVAFLAAFGVAFVTGIAFHEFSHAWAAYQLGDDTAQKQGRLTLNPLAHLDPMGTVLLALVGFGWGKPTPVNMYRLEHGPKVGGAVVAVAGPASNFFFALIAALPLKLGLIDSVASFDDIGNAGGEEVVGLFLVYVVFLNILLGVFNLIPIHPLDGFKVLLGLLPDSVSRPLSSLAPWGPGILLTLLAIGWVTPYNPIGSVIGGLGNRVFDLIV